jgi:hypothetical protein
VLLLTHTAFVGHPFGHNETAEGEGIGDGEGEEVEDCDFDFDDVTDFVGVADDNEPADFEGDFEGDLVGDFDFGECVAE